MFRFEWFRELKEIGEMPINYKRGYGVRCALYGRNEVFPYKTIYDAKTPERVYVPTLLQLWVTSFSKFNDFVNTKFHRIGV